MQTTRKNLVLLGMMAVGKTTLGRILAEKLSMQFIDTDKNIEKENFMKIGKIFETKGELFFRKEEEKTVLNSLKKENCVIALGGGAFMNNTVREQILKSSISFWLKDDIKILNKRTLRRFVSGASVIWIMILLYYFVVFTIVYTNPLFLTLFLLPFLLLQNANTKWHS